MHYGYIMYQNQTYELIHTFSQLQCFFFINYYNCLIVSMILKDLMSWESLIFG